MDHFSLLLLSRDCCCIFSVQLLSCLMTSFTVEYEFHLLGSSSKPVIIPSQPDQSMRGGDLRRYSRVNQKMQIASTRASRGLSSVCCFSGLLGDASISSSALIFDMNVHCMLCKKGNISLSKADQCLKTFWQGNSSPCSKKRRCVPFSNMGKRNVCSVRVTSGCNYGARISLLGRRRRSQKATPT